MTDRLPAVSGSDLIGALERVGWQFLRQRGSHVRLQHSERRLFLVVSLHNELKWGTLNRIPKDARLSREELKSLL